MSNLVMSPGILVWTLSAFLTAPALASTPATLGEALALYQVEVPRALALLPISKAQSREGQLMRFAGWIAGDSEWRVEVEIDGPYTEDAAQTRVTGRTRSIERMYQGQVTPYPGEITRLQECPADLKPKVKKAKVLGFSTQVLLARATPRFTLGVCDPKEASVAAALGWVYRKKRTELVEIKIFHSKKSATPASLLPILSEFRERN